MRTLKIPYGGDYNPEQWPEETWPKDMYILKAACVNTLTLNVFSWAALEPAEGQYDFRRLDRIVKTVSDAGMDIIMATSTAAVPAWMSKKYPDILRMDYGGIQRLSGGRGTYCPNSRIYRNASAALAGRLASHYKGRTNIIAWHISNEYGEECYCDNCARAFREWLRAKYNNSIQMLNEAWGTDFWGHTFYDFDEITLPDSRTEHLAHDRSMYPVVTLEYRRFMSDSRLACYRGEADAIRAERPDARITTNFMGFYPGLDYYKWAPYLDFISWDSYPSWDENWTETAMPHDLMRGLKGGQSFWLMEQTPSVTNWQPFNAQKRPGVLRLESCTALAHGSDSVLYFQMRQSRCGCECLHGAVIDHSGRTDTRTYREISTIGKELDELGMQWNKEKENSYGFLGARTPSEIALVFSWESWWAADLSVGPSIRLTVLGELRRWYDGLRRNGYNVDFINLEDYRESSGGAGNQDGRSSLFSKYRIVIAPVFYMIRSGEDETIRKFVKDGGIFVTTYFSGYTDETDAILTGGFPAKLRDITGVWAEELDALPDGRGNEFVYNGVRYPAETACDVLHLSDGNDWIVKRESRVQKADETDAEDIAAAEQLDGGYLSDYYKGCPVIARHRFGDGVSYYIGTASSAAFYRTFTADLAEEAGIRPVLEGSDEDVELSSRVNAEGDEFIFIMNHSSAEKRQVLPNGSGVILPPYGCRIIMIPGSFRCS